MHTSIDANPAVMPSAHGAIFCRKELREKDVVKVRFFLELNQHTQPIFCRKQLREKKSAHTDRLFILYLCLYHIQKHCII